MGNLGGGYKTKSGGHSYDFLDLKTNLEQKMLDIADNIKKALVALSERENVVRNLPTLLKEDMRILMKVLMRGRKDKG